MTEIDFGAYLSKGERHEIVVDEFKYESTLDISAARNAATKTPRKPSGSKWPTRRGSAFFASLCARLGNLTKAIRPGMTIRNGINPLSNAP